jgi:predicted dinucleotide-binding enzyme
MKIGIIGSGVVGRALGTGFVKYGHSVMLGTRDPKKKEVAEWVAQTPGSSGGTFEETAKFGELIVLAVLGSAVDAILDAAGPANFSGKTVIDTVNPIAGGPPVKGILKFTTGPNESICEHIQARIPDAHVVKAFNSVGEALMVNPQFADGQPTMFYCGNDEGAKKQVAEILVQFGYEPYDCGPIEAARAIEPLCILWCLPGFQRNEWNHAFKMLSK